MNPDRITLEALARIKRTEPSFYEWLKNRHSEYCKNISEIDGTALHWMQGRMQEIKQIIDTMERAEKL